MKSSISCPKCGRVMEVNPATPDQAVECPHCRDFGSSSTDKEADRNEQVALPCPKCNKSLRLIRHVHDKKRIRCNTCQTRLLVSADPWNLSVLPSELPKNKTANASPHEEDEIVLIPVSDAQEEPLLIPVFSSSQNEEDEVVLIPVPKRTYFTPTLWVGWFIGLVAIAGCIATLFFPLAYIPRTLDPGSPIAYFQSYDNVPLIDNLSDASLFLILKWLPLSFIPLILVGILMPGLRLRGGILLVTGILCGVLCIFMISMVQDKLAYWTPLMRLVKSNGITDIDPFVNPRLGFAVWILLGVGGLLLIAAGINLLRTVAGLSFLILSVLMVGGIGGAYLNHWFLPVRMHVQLEGTIKPAVVTGGGFGPVSSSNVAVLSIQNGTKKPLVLVATEPPPQASGSPIWGSLQKRSADHSSKSGSKAEPFALAGWTQPLGKPDLVLNIEKEAEASQDSSSAPNSPEIVFSDQHLFGCIIGPMETKKVSLCFTPVWDRKKPGRDSMAGPWTVRLQNVNGEILTSTRLDITGVKHPDDKKVEDSIQQFRDALSAVQQNMDQLLKITESESKRHGKESRINTQSILAKYKELRQSQKTCQSCMNHMIQLGTPPGDDDKIRLANIETQLNPTLDSFFLFLDAIEQRQLKVATTHFSKISGSNSLDGELGNAFQKLLPGIVIEKSQLLSNDKQHQAVILLLMSLEENAIQDSDRTQAGNLLYLAAIASLESAGCILMTPGGDEKASNNHWRSTWEDSQQSNLSGFAVSVLRRAFTWNKSITANEDFAYSCLLAKEQAGILQTKDVTAFAERPTQHHGDEALCWIGFKSLEKDDLDAANKCFARVCEKWPEGNYKDLAQMGQAIAEYKDSEDDVLERVLCERSLIDCQKQRNDWSARVNQLLPSNLARSSSEMDWVDMISRITDPDDLAKWQEHGMDSIPWFQIPVDQVPEDVLATLKKSVNEGKIVLANAAIFENLTKIHCQEPEPSFWQNRATPIFEWDKKELPYPFLKRIESIQYNVTDSKKLVSVKTAESAGGSMEGFLRVNDKWLACAAWIRTVKPDQHGAVVFFPDHISDTHQGRLFMKSLVEFSMDAEKNKTGSTPHKSKSHSKSSKSQQTPPYRSSR